MTEKPIIIRHRIGWLAFALLPLLGVGIGVFYAGFKIQFHGPESVKPGAGWALMALGACVTFLCLGAMTMRWDIVIDRAAGQIRRTRGTMGMNRSFAYDLGALDQVLVHHGTITARYGKYDRYYVRLGGKDLSIYIHEFSSANQARKQAETIGRYLEFPVVLDEKSRASL